MEAINNYIEPADIDVEPAEDETQEVQVYPRPVLLQGGLDVSTETIILDSSSRQEEAFDRRFFPNMQSGYNHFTPEVGQGKPRS